MHSRSEWKEMQAEGKLISEIWPGNIFCSKEVNALNKLKKVKKKKSCSINGCHVSIKFVVAFQNWERNSNINFRRRWLVVAFCRCAINFDDNRKAKMFNGNKFLFKFHLLRDLHFKSGSLLRIDPGCLRYS